MMIWHKLTTCREVIMEVQVCNPNTQRQRQKELEFKASLSHKGKPCLKQTENTKQNKTICRQN